MQTRYKRIRQNSRLNWFETNLVISIPDHLYGPNRHEPTTFGELSKIQIQNFDPEILKSVIEEEEEEEEESESRCFLIRTPLFLSPLLSSLSKLTPENEGRERNVAEVERERGRERNKKKKKKKKKKTRRYQKRYKGA
ncbi:hypothetical protein TorRG33x02_283810 [Trema orientale]|uniref:Uncharacterized protein n=1 Tax=Trema orientale TaxID=63057 RepID=A0A2P5CIE5_TREOI|nr:hypothetical protein TorRG33x02_283810 [Trema orientale]